MRVSSLLAKQTIKQGMDTGPSNFHEYCGQMRLSVCTLNSVCGCMAPGQSDEQSAWMCAANAELDLLGESHATEMTDEQVVQKLPEELRRQSLSGTLPVSLNTLRVSLWNQQLPLDLFA